jgi:4-amino-4-deoxy-L-arabinose transferase-like glycosyltransferase
LALVVFVKTYNIESRFPFGWDQARDANMAWQIIRDHKLTLIGPQVVSDDAFFLGPLWYYLLVPFYFLFNMNPLGAGAFAVINAVVTTLALYFLSRKLLGTKEAVFTSLIYALLPDAGAWNPILIPLLVIGTLWSLLEIIDGKKKYIILSFLLLGLGLQIHFQAIFFVILLIFSFYVYYKYKNKLPVKELIYGIGIFIFTFLPLIIFDLRHNFINFNGVFKLFGIGVPNLHNQITYLSQIENVLPKFLSTATFFLPNFMNYKVIIGPIILICALVGIYKMRIKKSKKILLTIFILLPVIIFSFYKGNLSEYYFVICTIPILLGFVGFLKIVFDSSLTGKLIVALLLCLLVIFQIKTVVTANDLTSLYYQKQTVLYLKQQKEDSIINVSFDVPVNADAGFKYLFKYYNFYPQNRPEGHLWTISIPAKKDLIKSRVIFGNMEIIRK